MFFSREYTLTERIIHKALLEELYKRKTSRGDEPRNKTQENSLAGSQVDVGFSDRNFRKNGYVTSKEEASFTILLLNACSLLNKFDEVISLTVSHKPHIIAITESWLKL